MKNKNKPTVKTSKIKANFNGGCLTNYAGILPIKNFMEKLGIEKSLDEHLSIKEGANCRYKVSKVLQATMCGLLSGHNRIRKIESFTQDPLVQQLFGLEKHIDEDTIRNKYGKFNQKHTTELMEVIGQLSQKVHRKLTHKEDILDIDSSVRSVYGKQEGAEKGYNLQRGKSSYHPLLAFLESSRECLLSWLRPGDTYTSNNTAGFLKQAFSMLPESVDNLLVRGDSGFFSEHIISTIEEQEGFTYLIKVKLKNQNEVLSSQNWQSIPGMKGWEMCDFEYQPGSWKQSRHFYAVRKLRREITQNVLFPLYEYDYFCYVSNLYESPLYIHDLYGDRGTCENWIEAVKNQLYAGSLLTHHFWANEALWLSSVLAYNISIWFRKLTDKKSWRQEPHTFRLWFIQLAGKLIRSGRKIYLKMYQAYHYKSAWEDIWNQILGMPFT